ncbi:MAG: hypothetical protein PVF43_02045 [Candidatus Eiseniibacteriota bacterium]|jgi:hypothetical protein
MHRRQFLVRLTLAGGAAFLIATPFGCGDDGENPTSGTGTGTGTGTGNESPCPPGTTRVFPSEPDATLHQHDIEIDCDAPPSSPRIESTANAGHTHTVELTTTELLSILGGGTVQVESLESAGHTHTWIFSL